MNGVYHRVSTLGQAPNIWETVCTVKPARLRYLIPWEGDWNVVEMRLWSAQKENLLLWGRDFIFVGMTPFNPARLRLLRRWDFNPMKMRLRLNSSEGEAYNIRRRGNIDVDIKDINEEGANNLNITWWKERDQQRENLHHTKCCGLTHPLQQLSTCIVTTSLSSRNLKCPMIISK